MYSMVTIVNNMVVYTCKLLRELILSVVTTTVTVVLNSNNKINYTR